ncbi:MAG: hypothetical protein WB783_00765 [Arenicellales bacterium]|jgi:hypothetical protein
MSGGAPYSHRERLEQALRWLDAQRRDDAKLVEEACRRFDLSPADEEFLQAMWRKRRWSQ